MRYAIVSDVHGNLEAFTAMRAHLAEQKVDRYAFLGDAVGYGPNPNEVCDGLREMTDIAIIGNHDAAVAGIMDYSEYYDAARQALDWCAQRLTTENSNWLKGLPFKHRENDLEFSHGAPLNPEMFDYLFAPEQVVDMLEAYDDLADVTFIGHSHLTVAFRVDEEAVTPIIAAEIICEPDAKYIITVGSVGQPRDRDPRSCSGIYDTETRTFTYQRVEYDNETTREKIIDAGLSPVFGERLLVGM